MSIDHNRIKIADLETNQPNKILITNTSGELEFSNINSISYNALDYTVAGKVLDARQGKILKDLINNINTVLASDNINLNTLQELADAIETVQNSLSTILVNDLTTGGSSKALTAEMGKILKDSIDIINTLLTSDNANLNTLQELVNAIEAVQNSLSTILVNDLTTGGTSKALSAEMGKTLQNNKVDKVAGKNLLSDTEIARLATLSNYTHPANHPANIITQDSGNRFVTDTEKATWNAKQSALGFVPENTSNKNTANGYAGLGADGKLISSQLPSITVNDTFVVASQAAMLALSVETGDIAVRTDLNKSFILKGSNSAVLSDWQELLTPTSAVTTVFGRNGAISSQTGDYNADQITETSGRKFQSASQQAFNDATSSIQTQLNSKASTTGSGASGTWPINVTGNANTVGGLLVHPDRNSEPNKIVRTDSNGYIQAGWINTVSGNSGTSPIDRIYASGDQYLRYYTPENFINTLGLATTATNRWYDGWITAPGYDANTIAENKSGFSYSNNCPLSGQLIHFGSGGYSLQLNSNYGSGIADVRFRTHNGDNGTWGSWGRFLTDGNYSAYSSFSGIVSSGNGFQTANYAVGARNRIWSFGDADGYGLSYFQGTAGQYGADSIGIHFGTSTNSASQFIFAGNGDLITSGLTTSSALGVAQTTGSGQGLSLYAGAVNGMPSYGLMFAQTSNYGGYGSVNGDWATYFTMAGATNRGWIFRSTNTNVASISASGVFTGSNFVGPLSGNADTATAAKRISFTDGPRTLSDRLPNSFARTVNFDFVNAGTIGGSGNYGGVMTFAPWDGLSASTGDSSYQLAFRNESGINGSGLPGLRLRKGIDTSWGGWYDMLHSGNYSSFSAFSGAITGTSLTVSGDVVAFSDARVKENIRPIKDSVKRIQASRGVLYDRIDTEQKDNIGFIAQELEEVFPELVITQEDGTKAVKYQNAVAVLFEAIKEQQAQIEEQLQINKELNKKIEDILQYLNIKQ